MESSSKYPQSAQPETNMAKSTSKFFRVATEGATTDGRKIDRSTIEQIAKTFNPATYGARIWLEHIRGTMPDGSFRAYGDVLAVKAEEVDTDAGKKMALFAQIDPTPDLIAMTKARQKIYSSLEISPNFADSGQPYLVGLGVTDSPASLGTEILTFAANSGTANPFAARKQNPDNLYSEAVEIALEFDTAQADPEPGKLATSIKNLFKKITAGDTSNDARFSDVSEAIQTVATHVAAGDEKFAASQVRIETLETALEKVTSDFASFKRQMDTTDANPTQRPQAAGGSGVIKTEF
ncbi:GPO family capsid scaffolding protein [Collimonas fungivorans]|nr:GPO family capsid scaffolding protein [Collimonas fungivorans]